MTKNDINELMSYGAPEGPIVSLLACATLAIDPEFLKGLERERFRKGVYKLFDSFRNDEDYVKSIDTVKPMKTEEIWKLCLRDSRWFDSKEVRSYLIMSKKSTQGIWTII